jgi:hypothetical protein
VNYRAVSLALGLVLLIATPVFLSLPALLPGIDGLAAFLAGVASFYLGLQLYRGELSEA